jgi:opacity protein-like surface antigen
LGLLYPIESGFARSFLNYEVMKTTLGIVLLIAGFSFISSAQNFDAGIVAGFAATQVDGDTYSGYNKAGPIVGIWVGRRINHQLYARMELRYIQKGSYEKKVQDGATTGYYRMRLNYFEIPLILGYRFGNGFNALIGLSSGYLGRAVEMNQFGPYPSEDIQKFQKFELAGMGGIEYNQSEHWAFNAVFSYSILPIRPHKVNIINRWNRGQYNNVIEVVARFKF